MLFLFEEIAVESAMIVATLVALGVLVYVLVGFAVRATPVRGRRRPIARSPLRARTPRSAATPERETTVADLVYILIVIACFVAVYAYARVAPRL